MQEVSLNIVIWLNGDADSSRICEDCISHTCDKPVHEGVYREIRTGSEITSYRSIGIRVDSSGAFNLANE